MTISTLYRVVVLATFYIQLNLSLQSTATLRKDKFVVFKDYTLGNEPILEVNILKSGRSKFVCFLRCQQEVDCKSISIKKDLSRLVDLKFDESRLRIFSTSEHSKVTIFANLPSRPALVYSVMYKTL